MFEGKTKDNVYFRVDGGRVSSSDPQFEKIITLLLKMKKFDYIPTDRSRENIIGQWIVGMSSGQVIQMSDAPSDDFDTHGEPDENGLCEVNIH